jgi:hypothetical protein
MILLNLLLHEDDAAAGRQGCSRVKAPASHTFVLKLGFARNRRRVRGDRVRA